MRFAPWIVGFVLLLVLAAAATPPAPPAALASAVEAMRRGRCAGGVDDLRRLVSDPTPTGARAAYLLGHCLRQAGRLQESREAFLAAAARYPTLRGYARYYAAQISLELGDPAGAEGLLANIPATPATPALNRRADILRGEVFIRSGRPVDAVRVLQPLTQSHEDEDEIQAKTWWLLGQAAEARGDHALAARAFAMAWWAIPGNPHAADAGLRLRRLAGGTLPPPPPEARAARATRLITMGETDEAERELALAVRGRLPADVAATAWYELGLLRLGSRRAVTAFEQAAQDRQQRDRALYWLGVSLYRSGRSGDGRATWDRLARLYPTSAWTARALTSLGRSAESRQRWAEADAWYLRASRQSPDAPSADEARWRRGWMRFQRGQYADAERIFREYAQVYPGTPRAAAHLYWAARVRMARGEPAEDLLRMTAQRYPLTFYGQRARARLGIPVPVRIEPPAPEPLAGGSFASPQEELAGLGFVVEAAEEAQRIAASRPSSALLRATAELHAQAGDPNASVAIAEPLLTPALYGGTRADAGLWALAYPKAFWDEVETMAERSGVDPYLALALMREESRFDPQAISPAQAFGLMQLLPSTAKGVLGGRVTSAQLMDPVVNIRAGTAYLGSLLRRYDGSVPLAVGAYNSGAGGVRRVRDLARTDLDRYVESLPYAETRTYVQHVLQSYGIYRWLYGPAPSRR